jgi:isoquinoline 1-oxidoreductase subunit alpha
MARIGFVLNGKARTVEVDPDTPLIWVIREVLGLPGTKLACGQGLCGSCTVLLNGRAIRSCITPVRDAAGARLTTIEGLAQEGGAALQRAWVAEDVAQCGYCQPGMLVAATALLKAHPRPTDAQVTEAMGDMLCRCGTYNRIRRAIHAAMQGVKK